MDKGLPLYHVERIIQETKERIEDGSHIIYVNGSYKNDDDPVGKLMHDFRCTSSIDMFDDELKNTVKYFKETEGERRQMCKAMEALDISEEDMKIMAGFGGGMFIGSTCGALVGSIAALSKMVCKTKAHEMLPELRPLIQKHTRNFKELLGNLDCAHIKPVHHSTDPNIKCMNTCLLAAKALEKTMEEEHLL